MIASPVVEVVDDAEALAQRACEAVLAEAAEALRARGAFAVAVSGGGTPVPTYRALARSGARTDLARWDVFLADERVVPADDPRSNARLVRESLLAGPDPPPRLFAPPVELGDPAAVARAYERVLRERVERLDLVMLGVGADGHTASLFPGDPALDERERLVVAAGPRADPPPRVTLTYPAIERARAVIVLVSGAAKRAALAAALGGANLPIARVRAGRRPLWIVDREACPPELSA